MALNAYAATAISSRLLAPFEVEYGCSNLARQSEHSCTKGVAESLCMLYRLNVTPPGLLPIA